MINMTLRVNTTMEKYTEAVKEKLPRTVKKHAFAIQAGAAGNAPVDTGTLKNSIAAEEVDATHWKIEDGVTYGVFQELGTSKGVKAKHFLGNASEKQADKFFQEVAEDLK